MKFDFQQLPFPLLKLIWERFDWAILTAKSMPMLQGKVFLLLTKSLGADMYIKQKTFF